jgi:hypothetical protein
LYRRYDGVWVVWVVSGSLEEVAASVRAVADMMPVAALSAAVDGLEHATMLLAHAVEGSSNSEVAEAIAALSQGIRRFREPPLCPAGPPG